MSTLDTVEGGRCPCCHHGMVHFLEEGVIRNPATREVWMRAPRDPEELCPHGMPLAENICGPCSQGKPNQPAKPTTERCEHGIPRQFCTAVHEEPFPPGCPVCLNRFKGDREAENLGWVVLKRCKNGSYDLRHPLGGATFARAEEMTRLDIEAGVQLPTTGETQ